VIAHGLKVCSSCCFKLWASDLHI